MVRPLIFYHTLKTTAVVLCFSWNRTRVDTYVHSRHLTYNKYFRLTDVGVQSWSRMQIIFGWVCVLTRPQPSLDCRAAGNGHDNASSARQPPFFSFFFFFSILFIVFALLFSLRPSRNSDPRSHSRLFSPPTHYGSCLAFLSRQDFSYFFPRRLASSCLIDCYM